MDCSMSWSLLSRRQQSNKRVIHRPVGSGHVDSPRTRVLFLCLAVFLVNENPRSGASAFNIRQEEAISASSEGVTRRQILSVGSDQSRRSMVDGGADSAWEKPLCLDGDSPGRWVDYSTWEADDCTYKPYTSQDIHRCLEGKWVHFYGDSTSRLMANQLAGMAGVRRRSWAGDKNRTALLDTSREGALNPRRRRRSKLIRITYLFRGRMWRSKNSSDMNNDFLDNLTLPNAAAPDFLIASIGAHEVIGWAGQPRAEMNFDHFKEDTDRFIAKLKETYKTGMLIWWKAHYIWPGKVMNEAYETVKGLHERFQDYAYRKFREAGGITTADFYQTTRSRQDLVAKGGAGVHYGRESLAMHCNILLNIMCNPR